MNTTLQKLFQYKAQADDALLTSLENLGANSPVTPLAIKALSHTYVVDQIFAAHLRRKQHAYTSANSSELPTVKHLSAALRASDREYVEYVKRLDSGELAEPIDFSFTDGSLGRMSREEILMHLITHGVGHRGQISALILLNSQTPMQDGFAAYLHQAEGPMRRRAA